MHISGEHIIWNETDVTMHSGGESGEWGEHVSM